MQRTTRWLFGFCSEMTHVTSSHISLVEASHMAKRDVNGPGCINSQGGEMKRYSKSVKYEGKRSCFFSFFFFFGYTTWYVGS